MDESKDGERICCSISIMASPADRQWPPQMRPNSRNRGETPCEKRMDRLSINARYEMNQLIGGSKKERSIKMDIEVKETMSKTIKTHDGTTILVVDSKIFYPIDSIATMVQATPEVVTIILEFNEEVIREYYPETPRGCLPETIVNELQKPQYRMALDLAVAILPFNSMLGRDIASDLPWGDDYALSDDAAQEYYIKRSTTGLDSVLQKLNPNLSAPKNYDGLLKLRQVAEILDLTDNQVRGLVSSGKLNYQRTHGERGQYRFELKSIVEYHGLINGDPHTSLKEVS